MGYTMESGVFTLSVASNGYIAKQEDITVDCISIECEDCQNSFSINLEKVSRVNVTDPVDPINNGTVIPQACEGVSGTVTVLDLNSGEPIVGAMVDVILLPNAFDITESYEVVTSKLSDSEGKVDIPMTLNGDYKISVSKKIIWTAHLILKSAAI